MLDLLMLIALAAAFAGAAAYVWARAKLTRAATAQPDEPP